MTRPSHPPTLLTIVRRTLLEECGVRPGDHILLAVSGGGDSIALMHALGWLAPRLGLIVSAHGVDHGLRAAARHELDLAADVARACHVRFRRSLLRVEPAGNLQHRARRARYEALHAAKRAAGARYLATAHHADDRCETVLLRLLRGAGPRGLAVLPARSNDVLRPMIRAPRTAVRAHLDRHRLPYALDPSNRDRRFLRVRVRGELMPLLEVLSPGISEHLNALADALAAGPLPVVSDNDGTPLRLGREQLRALRRAIAQNLGAARIALPGGRELTFDMKTGSYAILRPVPET